MTARILGLTLSVFGAFAAMVQLAAAAPIGQLTNEQYNASVVNGDNNESSLTVVTTGDLILNRAPLNTNYSGCCEATGGTTAPFTDGTMGSGNNAGTNNTNALFDLQNQTGAGPQPWYVEYQLPASGKGYDITSATVFSGHQDTRVNQSGYDVLVSKDGVHFTSLSDGSAQPLGAAGSTPFSYNPASTGGAAESTVSPISGLTLATGIRYVEFVDQSLAGGSTFGNTVYREFVVYGTQTVPEPSSFILGGLAAVGLAVVVRRRRKA